MKTPTPDWSLFIENHLEYIFRFRSAVYGLSGFEKIIPVSSDTCALGTFLQSLAGTSLSRLPAYKELMEKHDAVHLQASTTYLAAMSADMTMARAELKRLDQLTRELVQLIPKFQSSYSYLRQ